MSQKLGILCIATGKYVKYLEDMIRSLVDSNLSLSNICIYVHSERLANFEILENLFPKIDMKFIQIQEYGWPEATLLRYSVYFDNFEKYQECDLLMHLDADMLVYDDFTKIVFNSPRDRMSLVIHPGFYRPSNLKLRFAGYFTKPSLVLIDIKRILLEGGLGTWETNNKYNSFVPRRYRKKYVCGGVWFGPKKAFFEMVTKLSKLVQEDYQKGLISRWHDESYLNWYNSYYFCDALEPSLCYESKFPHMKYVDRIIEAVDKKIVNYL